MGARVYGYVRRHHLGLVALFVALGGTAWAGSKIGADEIEKNAIRAKHVKDERIGTAEIANDGSPKVLTGEDITGLTGEDITGLTGEDIVESTLGKVGDADTLDGLNSSAFAPAGRVRNTGRIGVDDPVAGDSALANRTLFDAGPFRLRTLCGENSDGSLEEAAVILDHPTATSIVGARNNPVFEQINIPTTGSPTTLLSFGNTGNTLRDVSFHAVAPGGPVLHATVTAEVNDTVLGGGDCAFSATAIAP